MTMKPSNIYKTFDVVTIPFPGPEKSSEKSTERVQTKIRPALVLSCGDFFNNFVGHTVLAVITSSQQTKWAHDIEIEDTTACGLMKPCMVRFKLFTIENSAIRNIIGHLSLQDQKRVKNSLATIFREML